MSGSLEKRGAAAVSAAPAPTAPELRRALALAANCLAGRNVEAELPASTRAAFERRRAELAAGLAPGPRDQVVAILASLDDMVARRDGDADEARFAFRRDVEDLAHLPQWALAEAAAAFRRGEAGDGRFRPTAGELARAAALRMRPFGAELDKLQRVLSAPVDPPRREPDAAKRTAAVKRILGAAEARAAGRGAPE
jgi:hypothetical protein